MDDVAADVGEAEVAAGVAVGEFEVVEAHLVEDGGLEVVGVDGFVDGLEAEVVGGAVGEAAFEAAAGDDGGEAVVVVVAAVVDAGDGGDFD